MKISDEERLPLKQRIAEACRAALQQRIKTAQAAIRQAQESANSEEKSSAGDKHETSRAMSQLDTEMNGRQMTQAERDLAAMDKLNTQSIFEKVVPGAVIVAGNELFFIGTGLGIVSIGEMQVIALSPQAPLAAQLLHKKAGDRFMFKGKEVTIAQIF